LKIQSMVFTDPAGIQHVANLTNLGGGGAVTGNATLDHSLLPGSSQTFTVNYTRTNAPVGNYTGTIAIRGSNGRVQVITSTIIVRN
jgi:hypothetical protein